MSYAQIKAIASGNPMILEKFKVDNEVQKLQDKERNYKAMKYRLEESLKRTIPEFIDYSKLKLAELKETIIARTDKQSEDSCNIEIDGKTFNTYKDAGAEILEFSNRYMELNREYSLGKYRGYELTMTNFGTESLFNNDGEARKVIKIKGKYEMSFDMLKIPTLNIKKLDDKLDELEQLISNEELKLQDLYRQLEQCKLELEKPFEYAEQLEELLKRKNEIDNELRLDDEKPTQIVVEECEEDNIEGGEEEYEKEEFLEEEEVYV